MEIIPYTHWIVPYGTTIDRRRSEWVLNSRTEDAKY